MLRSRLFWKLYAGFAAVLLITAATVWVVGARRVRETALSQLRANLVATTRILERLMAEDPPLAPPALRSMVSDFGARTGARFTVIAADGSVLADSAESPEEMENHAQRPEVLAAAQTGAPAFVTRFSRTVRQDMMYAAVALPGGRGTARVALPLTFVRARLADLGKNLVLALSAAAILSLLLGVLLFRAIARPLAKITTAAEAVAAGDYDTPIPHYGSDEVGNLAVAVGRMSGQLRERLFALTEERNRLYGVLSGMLEGLVAVDREERVVHMNAPAGLFLGVRPEAAFGQRIWEITRVEPVSGALAEVLAGRAESSREVRLPKPLRERVLELHAAPFRDAEGRVAGAVLVLHDVSRLRRLETVRRDFVANVSHELKTPLTAIRGYAETMLEARDGEIDAETSRRFLGRIHDQTLRLSALVTDLLTLSRVESGEGAVERAELDLRGPLTDCIRRFSADCLERGQTFSGDLPAEPVNVIGDPEALRQAMDNLLDNAMKYTPTGGRVILRCATEGDKVTVEVEDTGIGIEPEHLDRIFERFYRVDKARSRELGGTGLGLSIVKHIVESHGGEVSVTSRPGAGSTFRVTLPRHTSPVV
jgi:two-component system phosphate regulon sensor histidine kinase PhoR